MDANLDNQPPRWLTDSLERSEAQIESGQTVPFEPVLDRLRASIARMKAGLEAPRPYPALKRHGRRLIIEGRYWISYSLTSPPVISGVFYVTADIPNRI